MVRSRDRRRAWRGADPVLGGDRVYPSDARGNRLFPANRGAAAPGTSSADGVSLLDIWVEPARALVAVDTKSTSMLGPSSPESNRRISKLLPLPAARVVLAGL